LYAGEYGGSQREHRGSTRSTEGATREHGRNDTGAVKSLFMKEVDIVIIHGPPKDIMNYTEFKQRLNVQIFSKLLLELDHDCTALSIFMRAETLK